MKFGISRAGKPFRASAILLRAQSPGLAVLANPLAACGEPVVFTPRQTLWRSGAMREVSGGHEWRRDICAVALARA